MEGSVSVLWWEEVRLCRCRFFFFKFRKDEGRQGRKSKGKRTGPPAPQTQRSRDGRWYDSITDNHMQIWNHRLSSRNRSGVKRLVRLKRRVVIMHWRPSHLCWEVGGGISPVSALFRILQHHIKALPHQCSADGMKERWQRWLLAAKHMQLKCIQRAHKCDGL